MQTQDNKQQPNSTPDVEPSPIPNPVPGLSDTSLEEISTPFPAKGEEAIVVYPSRAQIEKLCQLKGWTLRAYVDNPILQFGGECVVAVIYDAVQNNDFVIWQFDDGGLAQFKVKDGYEIVTLPAHIILYEDSDQ